MKLLRTIRSYRQISRWHADSSDPIAWLARVQVEEIKTPYSYSPSKAIVRWNNRNVACFETAHREWQIYEVPPEMLRFKTEAEAEEWHLRYCGR